MTDISREATEGVCNHIHESKAGVHVRAEAQIIIRALRAALDRAEADKVEAVEAEKERILAVILPYCGVDQDEQPEYIDLFSDEVQEMFAAIRNGGKP